MKAAICNTTVKHGTQNSLDEPCTNTQKWSDFSAMTADCGDNSSHMFQNLFYCKHTHTHSTHWAHAEEHEEGPWRKLLLSLYQYLSWFLIPFALSTFNLFMPHLHPFSIFLSILICSLDVSGYPSWLCNSRPRSDHSLSQTVKVPRGLLLPLHDQGPSMTNVWALEAEYHELNVLFNSLIHSGWISMDEQVMQITPNLTRRAVIRVHISAKAKQA